MVWVIAGFLETVSCRHQGTTMYVCIYIHTHNIYICIQYIYKYIYTHNIYTYTYTVFCSSVTQVCPTLCDPWIAACQASLSFTISQSLLKLMLIESVMPSRYLILCHSLLLLPSIFPSMRVSSNESALTIMWPKF